MLKVKYSPKALDDIQKLREYILSYWDEFVSKWILKKITDDIRKLEQYSHRPMVETKNNGNNI